MASKGLNASIKSHIATLGQNSKMSYLDLNVVGWYNNLPKLDLRYWTDENVPDGRSGGITLTLAEAKKLRDALNQLNFEVDDGLCLTLGTPLQANNQLTEVRAAIAKQMMNSQESVISFDQSENKIPW